MGDTFPKIYLARHGETEWSLSGQHTGRADIPLTPHGEELARGLGVRLRGQTFSAVFTSPLQRAKQTCRLAGFGAVAKDDPDLMEWSYGQYEGRKTPEIRAERPDWNLYRDGCPDGESPADISARADRVVARLSALGGQTLIFSHQDFLRVLTARWLGLPATEGQRLILTTASLSILGYNHTLAEPVIRLWNEGGT
jgi:probable phosphoglycerate mutase